MRFRLDQAGLTNLYAGLAVSGNLVVDTSTFAVDSTNDRIGIGTATPAHTLDILRSTNGDDTINVKSTAAGDPTLRFDSATANRSAVIRFMDQGSLVGGRIQYVHNGDRMDFQSGSSSGASMSITNGAVGIGTTAPSNPLQIVYNGGHTSGNVALANSAFVIYNNLEANTDEKGSILTFSDNYYSSSGYTYHLTILAGII